MRSCADSPGFSPKKVFLGRDYWQRSIGTGVPKKLQKYPGRFTQVEVDMSSGKRSIGPVFPSQKYGRFIDRSDSITVE